MSGGSGLLLDTHAPTARRTDESPSCDAVRRLPFDGADYLRSLTYIGEPLALPSLRGGVLERPIPGSARTDAYGSFPYSTPWSATTAASVVRVLRARGLVSLTMVFRPDGEADVDGLRAAGIECRVLKEHFVVDRGVAPPVPGRRTRRNLACARRHWRIEPVSLRATWRRLYELHDVVVGRRPAMNALVRPGADHFRALASVPGMMTLGAIDQEGLAGALVVALTATEAHCHMLFGNDRYLRRGAAYALLDAAVGRWGESRRIYLGGAPSGPDGVGIARFKRRFATRTSPALLATAILDPHACSVLSAGRAGNGYFPPYRA